MFPALLHRLASLRPLACLFFLAVLAFAATTAFAQESRRHYLSGTGVDDAVAWDFFCTEGLRSGEWTTIPVPSQWDALGFGALAYGHRPDASEKKPVEHGKYRTRFRTPADWSGHAVFLVFEGAMTDTQAWVNGQSAGPLHQGGFYRFRYDVTALLKSPGEENLLEVDVAKDSADASINRAERQGDYWNFGGIFRPVYLEARPARHIDRVAIDARADGAFAIDVFTAGNPAADTLRAQILDLAGSPVGSPITRPLDGAKTRLETKIDAPRTWSAETPELYQVEVTLLADETPLHRVRQRFGFRTLEVRPGAGLFVNGQRVLLKGTNRHTFHPEHGRASSARLSREDILLMKEMNNNAVRMSHYPPDEHFLDLCDEIGLYVLDEIAGWQKSYDEAPGRRIVGQTVARDVNHPSILFWDNGNEGGWNTALDDDFARWDPQQRPVLHPWAPFRGIDTKHYPRWDLHLQKAKGPDLYMPTEFMHALFDGGGGASLKDYWEVIRTSPIGAGGFIWAFVDECMKRPDRDGPLDGRGNLAPDGILGPYREKEGSFHTVKELWSPIVATRAADGAITVENRYDFTDASRCVFTWQLRRFPAPGADSAPHRVIAEGRVASPSIAPHASASLPLELPADASSADALALRVDDPSGRELWTWVWPLRSAPAASPAPDIPAPSAVTATEDATSITLRTGDFSATFAKADARLLTARRGETEFPLRHGPRLAIGDAALATITHRADGRDHVVTATFTGNLHSIEWRLRPDGALLLDTSYALDTPCDYFGLSFDLPESEVRGMRWLGDGPFRVWKNRRQGVTLGVWENALNHIATGYESWGYPEFKGYYANVRWLTLRTVAGPITVELEDPSLFVQVLRPDFPGSPKPHSPTTIALKTTPQHSTLSANAWANVPDAGFSLLHGIAPIGTKFDLPYQLGPEGQQNRPSGTYRARATFRFGAEN